MPPETARIRVSPLSESASPETVLHSFSGPGAAPDFGMIRDKDGTLYGTTIYGGHGGDVFRLTPRGSVYDFRVIYQFRGGADGNVPEGVAIGRDRAFYGVTFAGGVPGNGGTGWGTVFKLTIKRSKYTKTTLYAFRGYPDAGQPNGPIVIDSSGTIYGSSQFGGASNNGAVFKVAPSGSGYSESLIYSFPGSTGGQMPEAGVAIDKSGDIYGTTGYGGSFNGLCGSEGGCGIVFKVAKTRSGYTEKTIWAFEGKPNDGEMPYGVPTVDDRTGAIYGTTYYGGAQFDGTVFRLVPSGSGYDENVLHSFTGGSDGFLPQSGLLIEPGGTVYGTASLGGGGCRGIGCGTIYAITPAHSGYSFRTLYSFQEPLHGADPEQTHLMNDGSGAILGTTRSGGSATHCYDGGPGGAKGCGVVFKLNVQR